MKKLTLLCVASIVLMSGLAMADLAPQGGDPGIPSVNIWYEPAFQGPIDPAGGGVMEVSFDIYISDLANMSGLGLFGVTGGGPALTFVGAELATPLLNLMGAEYTATDTGHPAYPMIGYAVTPKVGTLGLDVTGPLHIATFTYSYEADALGTATFELDQTWESLGQDQEGTKSYLTVGNTLADFAFIPTAMPKYGLVLSELNFGAPAEVLFQPAGQVIPEPTAMILLGTISMGLVAYRRRK